MAQPNFRSTGTQVVEWGNEQHTVTFAGWCVVCGVTTYSGMESAWLDHNDQSLEASDYEMVGVDVPLCFNCANTESRYHAGLAIAKRKWKQVEPA